MTTTVTTAEIESAVQRGRHLRSKAFASFFIQIYRRVMNPSVGRDRLLNKPHGNCAASA